MTTIPKQRLTRRALVIGGAVASAVAIGVGVGVAQAADERLDEADLSLQKAAALLEASETGGNVSPKAQKRFDQAVARAIANVEKARVNIVKAKDAVDNP